MASTIVIPSTNADNTLYSGLADVFNTYTRGVKTRRDEEEAEFRRSIKQGAALRKRNDKIRADKKKERSLEEMFALGDSVYGKLRSDIKFDPSVYDPSIDASSTEVPLFTKEQQDQARFALKSKYPVHLQKLDPRYKSITDSVKRKTLNTILNQETGLTAADRRKSLVENMMDFAKTSGVKFDEGEFSKAERKEVSNNIDEVMRRIYFENPNISEDEILSIYRKIRSDPSNTLNIRNVHPSAEWLGGFGMDDVIPLSVEDIYTKVRSKLPQDSGQGQQSAPISETTEKTTGGQTFAGVHAQTGQPITVTEKEIIMAARERFPNVNIEIAIAKVKQELGLK